MSNPTAFMLAQLTAEQAARWALPFGRLLAEVADAEAVSEGMSAWSRSDAFLSDRVQSVFWQATSDWSLFADLSAELHRDAAGVELVVARKLAPMAVLLPGLGWNRTRRLPGVAGLWLLDPDHVRKVAGEVERVFALSPAERSAVLDRMAQALLLGDEPDLDLDHLLDMVPRAFATATECGMGMVSCTAVAQ